MGEQGFTGIDNVQGTAIGYGTTTPEGSIDGVSSAMYPGDHTLTVFLAEPASIDTVRRTLVAETGLEEAGYEDFPLSVVVTGLIDAQAHRFRIRPAPAGVSTAHYRVTAGTLGCLATGRSAPRNSRRLILSNNHVLANSNQAAFGDCITQPGSYDGGRCSNDQVGILERFVPIRYGGAINTVDCATAWAVPDRVRPELVYVQNGTRRLFRIANTPVAPAIGMLVGKTGRTTQLTAGRIMGIAATIRVNFPGGVALFQNQIQIGGLSGVLSSGGDSGSCIWTWDSARRPVGLLFAGGGSVTFANRMANVLSALDIRLTT